MSVNDYVDRQVDLLVLHDGESARTPLVQSLADGPGAAGGAVIAGPRKLAQDVLLCLLTVVGSKKFEPAYGTSFLLDGLEGRWRTVADLQQSFYAATLDVQRQLGTMLADAPDDEQLDSLELLAVRLSGDGAAIKVRVLSRAGVGREVLAPLPVLI